jgi:beta-phosphoglucomutase
MEGAVELLDALSREGILIAVGSSGPPENVGLVLERLGRPVRAVVTGMEVTRGKPDPQVFLLAAERLGVPAEYCAVVEDAPAGIEAARAAGMAAVALVSTGRSETELRRCGPDLVVRSLRDLDPSALRRLRP